MAKRKKVTLAFDFVATCDADDFWRFRSTRLEWGWRNMHGVNLWAKPPGAQDWMPVCWVKNLECAACFAAGVDAGLRMTGKEEQEG